MSRDYHWDIFLEGLARELVVPQVMPRTVVNGFHALLRSRLLPLLEAGQAVSDAANVGYPHDDCCLKSDGHMGTCNKWKHEVIRRIAKWDDIAKEAAAPAASKPEAGAAK